MKKLISLLTAALLMTAPMTAYAVTEIDQNTTPPAGETQVNVNIDHMYTVTIPADITVAFGVAETDFGKVELTEARLDPGKGVKVSLTHGDLKNSADAAEVIPYTVTNSGAAFTSATYTAKGDSTTLKINITQTDWDAAAAGAYSDTVSFNIAYVDAD